MSTINFLDFAEKHVSGSFYERWISCSPPRSSMFFISFSQQTVFCKIQKINRVYTVDPPPSFKMIQLCGQNAVRIPSESRQNPVRIPSESRKNAVSTAVRIPSESRQNPVSIVSESRQHRVSIPSELSSNLLHVVFDSSVFHHNNMRP